MSSDHEPARMLAKGDVARLLACSKRQVQRLVSRGHLLAVRDPHHPCGPLKFWPKNVLAYQQAMVPAYPVKPTKE